MNEILKKLINKSESTENQVFENALLDLRLVIERFTQDRYKRKEYDMYQSMFSDKELVDFRIDSEDIDEVKHFLFNTLLSYPDRATLVAKCIKVLFDKSAWNAICAAIEIYMNMDDNTTCELIFAITDLDDDDWYKSKRIVDLFTEISKTGGAFSKEAAVTHLEYRKKFG